MVCRTDCGYASTDNRLRPAFTVQLMDFPHASEAFKKRNPHLFPGAGVARLPYTEREHLPLQALDEGKKAQPRSKTGVVRIVVTIISFRRREVDLDNVIAGAKPLRDAIAKSLDLDDGDKRLIWEYGLVTTRGTTGTQVIISRTSPCEQQSKQT